MSISPHKPTAWCVSHWGLVSLEALGARAGASSGSEWAAAVIREQQEVPVTGKSLPKADREGKVEGCWCDLNQSTPGLLSTHQIPPWFSHFIFSGQGGLTSGLHPNEAILHDVDAPDPVLAPVRRREVAAAPQWDTGGCERWVRGVDNGEKPQMAAGQPLSSTADHQ